MGRIFFIAIAMFGIMLLLSQSSWAYYGEIPEEVEEIPDTKNTTDTTWADDWFTKDGEDRGASRKTNEGKKKVKRPIGRLTMFITEEQMEQLAQLIKEDGEFGGGALTTSNVGVDGPNDWQYDVPFGAKSKNDPAMDHKNILSRKSKANQPVGHIGESKSGIHIDPENKGKFTATKKRTGKSTEELTHSKNPLTRKRAQFALNAKKWSHKKKND